MHTTLNNTEYNILLEAGGDDLIAFFGILRYYKEGNVYKKAGRKGSRSTIRHYTGLSLNTISKYLPKLIEIGFCEIHKNGNIALISRKRSSKLFRTVRYNKLLKLKIGKFTETKTYSYYIRVHSNLKSQEKGIEKHAERIKLFCKYNRGDIKSLKELNAVRKLERKGLSETTLKSSHRSNSTLANSTFSKLKKEHSNKKSSGHYQKTKLVKAGLISQKRSFEVFKRGVFTKSDLNYLRNEFMIPGLFLTPFGIIKECSSDISICNSRY